MNETMRDSDVMAPEDIVAILEQAATAVREAVGNLSTKQSRVRTDRPGQYELDRVADAVALGVLLGADFRVVSEESGIGGNDDAPITVVLDPVDASTNCARGLSYWATSLCALDSEGPLVALVANQASGTTYRAVRGGGAFRDGEPLTPSPCRRVEDAVVALSGMPARLLMWKQFRALGCASLALCDVAAGGLDGYVDGGSWHAPWDYLGGYLVCFEAGAQVIDQQDRPLVLDDPSVRRQIIAAGTPELLSALMPAAGGSFRLSL